MKHTTAWLLKTVPTNYSTLYGLLYRGRIRQPERNESNRFLWTDEDVHRIREILAKSRRRRKQPAEAVAL